jgi:hypothetical protein
MMMKGKRGQSLILAILAAVMIFVAGMLFLNHIKDDVTLIRSIGMDCSNPTISDGAKATCLGIDLVVPIVIILVVSATGGAILSRFII